MISHHRAWPDHSFRKNVLTVGEPRLNCGEAERAWSCKGTPGDNPDLRMQDGGTYVTRRCSASHLDHVPAPQRRHLSLRKKLNEAGSAGITNKQQPPLGIDKGDLCPQPDGAFWLSRSTTAATVVRGRDGCACGNWLWAEGEQASTAARTGTLHFKQCMTEVSLPARKSKDIMPAETLGGFGCGSGTKFGLTRSKILISVASSFGPQTSLSQ